MNHIGAKKYVSPRERELTPSETWIRRIAYGLKAPEDWAVGPAAEVMAPHVSSGAILVPIPNSEGCTAANVTLSIAIKAILPDVIVIDALTRLGQVTPSHKLRGMGHSGNSIEEQHIVKTQNIYTEGREIILIDNVLVTGATFDAAILALGQDGWGLAYSKAEDLT